MRWLGYGTLLRVGILVKGRNMRLRVAALLEEHGMTAYELAKRSGGRIPMSRAYRLQTGEFTSISAPVLDALCDVFGLDNPGPIFEREKTKHLGRSMRAVKERDTKERASKERG